MYRNTEIQKAANLDYQSSFSIDKMIENIGAEESKELLIEALPIIIARKGAILKALAQNDISAASKTAHRTAGSIRLYGSSSLEMLLAEVMGLSVNVSPRSALQAELESEFDAAIHEIQSRLRVGLS